MEAILLALEKVDLEDSSSIFPEEARIEFDRLLSDSLSPTQSSFQDRSCEEKDFKKFRPFIEKNLSNVKSFLIKLNLIRNRVGENNLKLKKNTVVLLLMLCGEHMGHYVWSTEHCYSHAQEILKLTCQLCNCSALQSLLVREQLDDSSEIDPLFKPILLALRPKLLKDTWKTNPAAVACFCWLLPYVKSPHLSDHLDSVLPTALILADDYIPENRFLGVNCLYHIVDNVPRTQLCWYGQADVVYEALFNVVYHREDLLATPVLKCLTLVVDKLESDHDAKDRLLGWTRRDDVLQLVLQQMETEQRLALRVAYARALPPLVSAMGLAVVRWASRLASVIAYYLEQAPFDDPEATLCILQVVETLARQSGERVEAHAPRLAGAVMRVLADATGAGATVAPPALEGLVAPALAAFRTLLEAAPRCASDLASALRPALPASRAPHAFTSLLDQALAPFDAAKGGEVDAGAA